MATLEQIIQQEINPFDPVTFVTGNFWTDDKQPVDATVESIHQSELSQIQTILTSVIKSHDTRSILLTGDSGCGKSYLLKRLQKTLNDRAFFVYIEACSVTDYIWRHTLRSMVDSLLYRPEGEKEPQLILWVKGLSAYKAESLKKKILGAKKNFIHELTSTYPTGIYQPKDFFSVLYELTNPDLYFAACDWLRGYSVSEDDLKRLGVGSVIDSEEAARGIIRNFGRISADNKPIVLCFDQVEATTSAKGESDPYAVFRVNTAFNTDNLKNFLIIISIIEQIRKRWKSKIPQSDLAKINYTIELKQITLEQVKALWANRLKPLHSQANPQPTSPIAPLSEEDFKTKYPGGIANLRDSLKFGGKLYQQIKEGKGIEIEPDTSEEIEPDTPPTPPPPQGNKPEAAFKLLWQREFNKTKSKISRIQQLSSPELVEMLILAMETLGIESIKRKILRGKYANYSFSYQLLNQAKKVGILWNEDSNMTSFFHTMKACEKFIQANQDTPLKLIRSASLGNRKNQGYRLYKKLFNQSSHIRPSLESVHYLKTYQNLVNDAKAGDLVVNYENLNLTQLKDLICQTKILHQCQLLQDLAVVPPTITPPGTKKNELGKAKEFLLNLVTTQHLLAEKVLIQNAKSQFPEVEETEIKNLIQELCKIGKISFVNPNAKPEDRMVCLVVPSY